MVYVSPRFLILAIKTTLSYCIFIFARMKSSKYVSMYFAAFHSQNSLSLSVSPPAASICCFLRTMSPPVPTQGKNLYHLTDDQAQRAYGEHLQKYPSFISFMFSTVRSRQSEHFTHGNIFKNGSCNKEIRCYVEVFRDLQQLVHVGCVSPVVYRERVCGRTPTASASSFCVVPCFSINSRSVAAKWEL